MKYLAIAPLMLLAACSSHENKEAYRQAQIDMVRQQQAHRAAVEAQRSAAEAAKWQAAKDIVAANPESADAFAVAMAVAVVQQGSTEDAPLVQLQREENEALQVVKAVAPALITTLGTVGTVALNADVAKTQSRNNAAIQINDATQDARIVEAVAGLGVAASSAATTAVNGDYYSAGGDIDQSTTQDSYNPITDNSVDNTDNSVDNTNNAVDNTTTYATPSGDVITLEQLEELIASGIEITVIIDGEEVPVEECEDGGLTFGGGSCEV